MKKRLTSIICLILLTAFALVNVGCNKAPAPVAEKIQVTDQLGRQVSIPKDIKRIATPYSIASSIIIALGAEDKIVGVEMNGDKNKIYQLAAPELTKAPAIGSGRTLNIEECLNLKPDLVILPTRMKDEVTKLEQQNIAVIAIAPEDLNSLRETIQLIGRAIGAEAKAKELADYYDQKIAMVQNLTKTVDPKPGVYLAGKENALSTCTKEMYQNYLIDIAGGRNVSQEIEKGFWANVSQEQVVIWRPEVVFIVQYAAYGPQDLLNDKKWQAIPAIQNKRVYKFPSLIEPWDYPTPAAILGILWATHTLHPDLYDRSKLEQDVVGFYEQFYNIKLAVGDFGI